MPKLCIVLGSRAQLIKTAPVMRELQERKIPYHFIYTAQHRDTYFTMLEDFGLKKPDQTLLKWDKEAGSIPLFVYWWIRVFSLLLVAPWIAPFRGGTVLIHGDSMSAMWGALFAKLSGNRLFHLESGYRSFNFFSPFPEEIVRFIILHLADVYACSSNSTLSNVQKYKGEKLNLKQNTVIDSLRYIVRISENDAVDARSHVIASFHRVENIFNDERLQVIIETIERVAETEQIIFPIHPVTKSRLKQINLYDRLHNNPNIDLSDRLPYAQFIPLMIKASYIITDSGSMQQEIVCLGTPTLVFRPTTEQDEGIGENIILSDYDHNIINEFLRNPKSYKRATAFPKESPSSIVVDRLQSY